MTTIYDSSSGDVENKYFVYGQGLIYEEDSNENLLIHHYDQVGSTTALTDGLGTLRETYEYSPYGDIHSGDISLTEFLYNGMYGVATDTNGLYYMRARYYNPTILRFINQDVVLGTLTDIQSLNRYAYCEGNPVSFLDPFGLCHEDTAVMHDVTGYINIVASILSACGLPIIGEPLAIIVNSFDMGLLIYDIVMDFKCGVDFEVFLSDMCKLLLDVIGILSSGIAKVAANEVVLAYKGEKFMNCYEYNEKLSLLEYLETTSFTSTIASITEFIAEKYLNRKIKGRVD